MYELEKINQNIIKNYFNSIAREVKRKNKILILQAIKYAVKKMLPNEMDKLLEPKIRQVGKTLDAVFERKIEKFNSIEEAQELFKEQYPEAYNHAFDNPNEEFSQMVMMAYDLCKYDTKLTYKGKTSFFNIPFIIHSFRQHYKADKRWLREKGIKPDERNINISLNTNKTPEDQVKFLEAIYEVYKDNPYTFDSTKEYELNIIDEYKEDRHMMARSINEITNVYYSSKDMPTEESKSLVQAYKNIKHSLDSDKVVERTDIINSWLTHIALLYTRVNPQGIPKTELSDFIVKIANYTTIYKEETIRKHFSPEKLRKDDYREKIQYKNLKLMEITDKRYKLSYNEKTTKETETYLNHIIDFLSKYQKSK